MTDPYFPEACLETENCRDSRITVATFVLIIHIKNPLSDTSIDKMPPNTEKSCLTIETFQL